VCPRERLVIISKTTGLSFALKRIGPLSAIIITVFYLLVLYLSAIPNTPANLFASVYSESLIENARQHLLLLVGFDPLIYQKYYDTPPILEGHQPPMSALMRGAQSGSNSIFCTCPTFYSIFCTYSGWRSNLHKLSCRFGIFLYMYLGLSMWDRNMMIEQSICLLDEKFPLKWICGRVDSSLRGRLVMSKSFLACNGFSPWGMGPFKVWYPLLTILLGWIWP
jgi:hypothetical protein